MEKKRPHYPLEQIKAYVGDHGGAAFTLTAKRNGFCLGLTQAEMVTVVLKLNAACF